MPRWQRAHLCTENLLEGNSRIRAPAAAKAGPRPAPHTWPAPETRGLRGEDRAQVAIGLPAFRLALGNRTKTPSFKIRIGYPILNSPLCEMLI